jgi:transcriptional regulator with XRE-family HTH domain
MPGHSNELIMIPDSFWQRPETIAALRSRAMGQFFDLLRQYAGASQTQIGMACGMAQSKISDIVRGVQQVETLAVFERIADGLNMPDRARIILGLAPYTTSGSPVPAQRLSLTIPSGDARPALEAHLVPDLLSLDPGDRQEEDNPVRRRTFVGLTGASMFSAMFADSARGKPFALRAAEETAPEEVAGRPSVQRLVRELVISAPPTIRRDAEHFARRIGAAR